MIDFYYKWFKISEVIGLACKDSVYYNLSCHLSESTLDIILEIKFVSF